MTSPLRRFWALDPDITFLNHGSFGATPVAVLEHQAELRARLEAEPVRFFVRELPDLWSAALAAAAQFVGADPRGFAFVDNATTGVNTILAALSFGPGDELLVTDHEYGACRNALDRIAAQRGAQVRVVDLPFPVEAPQDVVAAIAAAITDRTRLLLIDHVTSPTGLVLPIAEIAAVCRDAGVEILVDGAHAPGMIDLNLDALGVDYYTGNFHKWVCTPKSAALLWVAPRHLERIRPLVTSHGAAAAGLDPHRRFRLEFDWTGTFDPTPALAVPFGIEHMASLVEGGWPAIRARNRELALAGRARLGEAFGTPPLAPPSMIGSLATVRIPDGTAAAHASPLYLDPDQDTLLFEHRVEVPLVPWPRPPQRLVRISAQLYNTLDDVERLITALHATLR